MLVYCGQMSAICYDGLYRSLLFCTKRVLGSAHRKGDLPPRRINMTALPVSMYSVYFFQYFCNHLAVYELTTMVVELPSQQ